MNNIYNKHIKVLKYSSVKCKLKPQVICHFTLTGMFESYDARYITTSPGNTTKQLILLCISRSSIK